MHYLSLESLRDAVHMLEPSHARYSRHSSRRLVEKAVRFVQVGRMRSGRLGQCL